MKVERKVLAAAVALGLALSHVSLAATLPSRLTRTLDNSPSQTTFAGGATINGGASFLSHIPADRPVSTRQVINVAPADQGQDADMYQVILVQIDGTSTWYQRNVGGWVAWEPDVSNLSLAQLSPYETRVLQAREDVSLDDIEAQLNRELDGGYLRVFSGYATDNSILTYGESVNAFVDPQPANVCPAGTEALAGGAGPKPLCLLSGNYTQNLHLTSNFDYVISGAVFIGGDNVDNADLVIDAGTTLYGQSGADLLVITRGSRIFANGAPDAPIIMTSANDASADASTRGQWGGLIINGNAPINGCSAATAVCEAQGEGSTGLYGGNDPLDDSGNLNYLVVKYAGYEITPENELNGIAFQGVGAATNVDYVQVHNNSDDGVEFFGGTVNAKHLVLTGISDDSLDWVLGWQGKVQHVVILQTDEGDQGFEADNLSSARDALPRSRPTIANVTLLGNAGTDIGMLLREGTAGRFSNVVVAGFGDACIDIDHSATFLNAGSSATSLSGELTMTNSIVDCAVNFAEAPDDNWSVESWFVNQPGNRVGGAGMTHYRNSAAVNAIPAADLSADPFFDQVDYIGAVKDAASDWTLGWTYREALDQ